MSCELPRGRGFRLNADCSVVSGSITGCAGDPRRLLHHLNLGVWSFLSEPAAGLMSTARGGPLAALPQGVAAGTTSLAANTLFAFSNAAVKLLTSWRRSLLLTVR